MTITWEPARLSPPGPKGNWLTGNLPEFRRGRLAFFDRCASTATACRSGWVLGARRS
ncbi:MAG: hypothetical protein P4L84_07970 [Isosphaeraceae bacterium]|nr:hypothetical protein [Isosphaeraceae bacterium]